MAAQSHSSCNLNLGPTGTCINIVASFIEPNQEQVVACLDAADSIKLAYFWEIQPVSLIGRNGLIRNRERERESSLAL